MYPILLAIICVVSACTNLPLPQCNVTNKVCYIHSNVCGATDILFAGLGSGWTYTFVLVATNCTTLACPITGPPVDRTFELSVWALQGLRDNNVTWNTTSTRARATFISTVCPLTSKTGTTAMVTVFGSGLTISNIDFDGVVPTGLQGKQSIAVGLLTYAAKLTLTDVSFTNLAVGVVVIGPTTKTLTLKNVYSVSGNPNMLPAIGPVLAAVSGCNINISVINSLYAQYVVLDYTVTGTVVGPVVFNVSNIVPYSVYVAPPVPPTAITLNTSTTAATNYLFFAGMAALAIDGVWIFYKLIARHYAKKDN